VNTNADYVGVSCAQAQHIDYPKTGMEIVYLFMWKSPAVLTGKYKLGHQYDTLILSHSCHTMTLIHNSRIYVVIAGFAGVKAFSCFRFVVI
jgi:hypothetical protein